MLTQILSQLTLLALAFCQNAAFQDAGDFKYDAGAVPRPLYRNGRRLGIWGQGINVD
jgi:hypothetical protein